MPPHTIEVANVSKRYEVEDGLGTYRTLRDALTPRRARRLDSATGGAARHVWALRDVDMTIAEGESVGIIGANGVGKTTLLKLLARITEPSTGVVRTRGRVGALLDVGTGFHPELTGAENIRLNGAVLGMRRKEIETRFADIAEFAGVERFLNTPVKHYSSGMYLRLAFSVAAHLRSPILVVDEVLAVGDADFQRKCLDRMAEFGGEGRTVVFVSHDMSAIRRLCPRVLWLDGGRVKVDASAEEAIESYLRTSVCESPTVERKSVEGRTVDLVSVAVGQESQGDPSVLFRDQPLAVSIRCRVAKQVPGIDFTVYLMNAHGVRVVEEALSDYRDLIVPTSIPCDLTATLRIPPVLPAGDYVVGIRLDSHYEDYVEEGNVLRFRLLPSPRDSQESVARRRAAQPLVSWDVEGLRG